MAVKKNYLKKNKDSVFNLFLLLVVLLLLSLIIPAIGASATAPALWVSIVNFFMSIRAHFALFWMFYTFGGAVLFAYLGQKK